MCHWRRRSTYKRQSGLSRVFCRPICAAYNTAGPERTPRTATVARRRWSRVFAWPDANLNNVALCIKVDVNRRQITALLHRKCSFFGEDLRATAHLFYCSIDTVVVPKNILFCQHHGLHAVSKHTTLAVFRPVLSFTSRVICLSFSFPAFPSPLVIFFPRHTVCALWPFLPFDGSSCCLPPNSHTPLEQPFHQLITCSSGQPERWRIRNCFANHALLLLKKNVRWFYTRRVYRVLRVYRSLVSQSPGGVYHKSNGVLPSLFAKGAV